MVKPSRIASMLRQIADCIDQSKAPSKSLVAADLRRVIASVDPSGNSNLKRIWIERTSSDSSSVLAQFDAEPDAADLDEAAKAAAQKYAGRTWAPEPPEPVDNPSWGPYVWQLGWI